MSASQHCCYLCYLYVKSIMILFPVIIVQATAYWKKENIIKYLNSFSFNKLKLLIIIFRMFDEVDSLAASFAILFFFRERRRPIWNFRYHTWKYSRKQFRETYSFHVCPKNRIEEWIHPFQIPGWIFSGSRDFLWEKN